MLIVDLLPRIDDWRSPIHEDGEMSIVDSPYDRRKSSGRTFDHGLANVNFFNSMMYQFSKCCSEVTHSNNTYTSGKFNFMEYNQNEKKSHSGRTCLGSLYDC